MKGMGSHIGSCWASSEKAYSRLGAYEDLIGLLQRQTETGWRNSPQGNHKEPCQSLQQACHLRPLSSGTLAGRGGRGPVCTGKRAALSVGVRPADRDAVHELTPHPQTEWQLA